MAGRREPPRIRSARAAPYTVLGAPARCRGRAAGGAAPGVRDESDAWPDAGAGLPRHRLYEHHADLLAEFKTTTNSGPVTASVQAMRQQLADARERIEELAANQARLKAQIATLCAIITELTHETQADNVVSMPSRTRTQREQT